MRKPNAFKTLLRTPLKALLTFLLVAAASFTLFARAADYAVTAREAANAESFYHGVAALDNTVPDVILMGGSGGLGYANVYEVEDKPWPTEAQLQEFSALPGVTLADTRYMTAGRVGGFRRLSDVEYAGRSLSRFVLEGTYQGYEGSPEDGGWIELVLDDVKVLASETEIDTGGQVRVTAVGLEETGREIPYPAAFFDKLGKGSRCLVVGRYHGLQGNLQMDGEEEAFCVLEGAPGNYLETEEFVYYKGLAEAITQSLSTYDIVYTSDMRAIPRFNERGMVISQGRPLQAGDRDACVVSELFLKENGLSIGSRVGVELGSKLFRQNSLYGATAQDAGTISSFASAIDLEIIGAYQFTDTLDARISESKWSYTSNTVFVPSALLPVEVPDRYELSPGAFSVWIEDARDIETFRKAAEPFAAEMGLILRFSDGGWLGMEESFQSGALASLLATVLYLAGAAMALFLAAYLYIGQNKKAYAIMRTLGVPGRAAQNALLLPLAALSALAMPIGAAAGLSYASGTASKALAGMAASAPNGYVPDTSLPEGAVVLCLFGELAWIAAAALIFLRRMKKVPPLELLQGGKAKAGEKAASVGMDTAPLPAGFHAGKLPAARKAGLPAGRNYGAPRHVTAYALRHMRRGIGKTAVSLALSAVLAGGIGLFVLARLTYQDAFHKMHVEGRALEFSSSALMELVKSDFAKEVYCYGNFSVRIDGRKLHTPMVVSNDVGRYLGEGCNITYAEGYDLSVLDSTGPVCLVGQSLAETLGIRPGSKISLMSDTLYSAMEEMYGEGEGLQAAAGLATKIYQVAGLVETGDGDIGSCIFAGMNEQAEGVYGQPFPIGYCEFMLADNEKLAGLDGFLDELKDRNKAYATMASYYIDSTGLENIQRICGLLESLFPIAVAAAALVGLFGSGLPILQSAQEAVFLRMLGVTKKRARCMLALGQVFLCLIGIALAACLLAAPAPGIFARSARTLAICWLLYFLGCACGILAAASGVAGLTQGKEKKYADINFR